MHVAEQLKKVKKPNIIDKTKKWSRELRSEAKKVVWPTWKQVVNNTAIVIAAILIIGIFIWIVDFLFGFGRDLLIQSL